MAPAGAAAPAGVPALRPCGDAAAALLPGSLTVQALRVSISDLPSVKQHMLRPLLTARYYCFLLSELYSYTHAALPLLLLDIYDDKLY